MPTELEVKERIERALPGSQATVTDLTGTGDHLRAEVTYDGFASLSRIEQHRLVYDVFGDEIGGPIHALQIKTVISLDGNDGITEGSKEESG
jgi:stress-induced morphogen